MLRHIINVSLLFLFTANIAQTQSTQQQGAESQDFFLHENGVTVMCQNAGVGDSGEVNGVTYTKRTREQITAENAATTCTSGITNMREMFQHDTSFNADISSWDVSSVTDMSGMFNGAGNFNQDLSNWEVSNVINMGRMFVLASKFNSDLSGWDVSNVTSMRNMFNSASAFNWDLDGWDVSNVTDMNLMFQGASSFNGDISSWDVSSVTNMSRMFQRTNSFEGDLSNWDVSSVIDMSWMFQSFDAFNGDIGSWDVSNVTNMRGMFRFAESFNQDISGWVVVNVSDMSAMFYGATSFDQNLGNWDVSQVNSFGSPGNGFLENGELRTENYDALLIGWSELDLQNDITLDFGLSRYSENAADSRTRLVEVFGWEIVDRGLSETDLFYLSDNGVTILCPDAVTGESGEVNGILYTKRTRDQITTENASTTCTSGITDMSRLFSGAESFNEDIGSWDTESVTDFTAMFSGAKKFNQDLNYWNTGEVLRMEQMFSGAESFNGDISNWDVKKATNMNGMFRLAKNFNINIGNWDVGNVILMSGMFQVAENFDQDIGNWDVGEVINMTLMFAGASSFNRNLIDWNVNNVTNMSGMFNSAESFNGDLSQWNVSNVTTTSNMFTGASSFNGDLSDWDVSNVSDMSGMFYDAEKFNGDLSNWDVSNVTTTSSMFRRASSFNGDLSDWDVSNVTNMAAMFYDAENFNSDLSNWDVSEAVFMNAMFLGAQSFNSNISEWEVGSVTGMFSMFSNATSFDQDLSSWKIQNVTQFDHDDFGGFLENVRLSTLNYDALIKEWSKLDLQKNLTFNAGNSRFSTDAKYERQILIDEFNWEISDGGMVIAESFTFLPNTITDYHFEESGVNLTLNNEGDEPLDVTVIKDVNPEGEASDGIERIIDEAFWTFQGTSEEELSIKFDLEFDLSDIQIDENESQRLTIIRRGANQSKWLDLIENDLASEIIYKQNESTISATDLSGFSDYAIAVLSIEEEPPSVVQLFSPENESKEVSTDTVLKWIADEYADNYNLQISKSNVFDTTLILNEQVADTTYLIDGLNFATNYYWRVKAQNENGSGPWSDTWNFTTRQSTQVQIIHNSADPVLEFVDIYISGDLKLEEVEFRTATGILEIPSNTELSIGITPSGESLDSGVIFQNKFFEPGNYYVVASGVLDSSEFQANPSGENIELDLDVIPKIENTTVDKDVFSFRINHGVIDAPPVDIFTRDVTTIAENFVYGSTTTENIDLPVGTYTIDIALTGGDIVASFEADVNDFGGQSALILASGFITPNNNHYGDPLGMLVVLTDGEDLMLPMIPTSVDKIDEIPQNFTLKQNYPNPFNPTTTIRYALPQASAVQLEVFNMLGQRVALLADEHKSAGWHTATFDASNLSSGMYIYRLRAGDFVQTRKLTLIK